MRLTKGQAFTGLMGAISLLGAGQAYAGQATYDFTADPAGTLEIVGNNDQPWQSSGGNPGGFLALTYPEGSQFAAFAFPSIDPDTVIVSAFRFEADLRVGNSTGDRAADGFSVSFARDTDPLITGDLGNQGAFAGGIAEGGTTTGIAVCFDTWSGNTLPDGGDIEGIIVRVDNKTVIRQSLPTRHGACDDATSLQTGPRDAAYWSNGGAPRDPASWATLCWQKLVIDLDTTAKLTVTWKGRNILDKSQTAFFPSRGRIILGGRTGGANEHTHFDNVKLTTTTEPIGAAPGAPTSVVAAETGARRALLTWNPSTIPGSPTARVAYKVYNGDVVIGNLLTDPRLDVRGLKPGTAYAFDVSAISVAGAESAKVRVNVTTVAEVDVPGWVVAEVYDGISGTAMQGLLDDPKFPASPDRGFYLNGLSFGEPAFGDTYGENHGVRMATVLTVPETGNYRFFVRSDDSSALYINTAGPAIPDPASATPVAQELGCCGAFEEPGAGDNGDGTFPTSEPISLTAGRSYGVLFLVKEGGGGDWGQVAWRREGDTTAASALTPIRGALLAGKGDPVGAVATITTHPASQTVSAYKSVTFTAAANTASPYTTAVVYQWYKNGAVIPGANSATYTIPVVQPADNNAKFKVLVTVPGAQATSNEATLTVADSDPAKIVSTSGSDSFTTATLRFDQPVAQASATVAGNYTITPSLAVSAAALVDQYTVRLTTARQTEGATYTVAVNNVQNLGGKPVAAGTTAPLVAWSLVSGRVRADQFTGFNGASITDMETAVADAKYPNNPDVVRYTAGLTFGEPNFGDTWGENHLVAMRGILKPTQTGSYRFFVRSDDASRLYINTTGATIPDATTATAIAQESGCCGGFEEPGAGNNGDDTFPTSEPVSLTAGQSYGVLYLVKEGGGGDWGQVAWRREGDSTAAGSLTPIVNEIWWYGPPAAPQNPTLAVGRTGAGITITYEGTLESSATVNGTYAPVAGATSPYAAPTAGGATFYRARR